MKRCCFVVLAVTLVQISGSQLPEPTCGERNLDGIGFRMTSDSRQSDYSEFPWMILVLQKEEDSNVYRCGGSLINPKVVLTAAQCVHQISAAQLQVRAGEWDIQTENELFDHQDRNVSKVVLHPEFDKEVLRSDIALLFLEAPVTLGEDVQLVCLPAPEAKFDMQRCFLSGWGRDIKEGKYQSILKKAELTIIPADSCQTSLGKKFVMQANSICTNGKQGEAAACKGDEGSPLVCPIQGSDHNYHQAGIVSWSIECGEDDLPSVYTDVAQYRNWIDQQMVKHQFDISSYVRRNTPEFGITNN